MACPELIVPELSGPSESLDGSTPETLKELVLSAPFEWPPVPWPPAAPGPPDPPLCENVPDRSTSLNASEPTAAVTSLSPATVVTADDLIVPNPPLVRMSRLTFVPFWLAS